MRGELVQVHSSDGIRLDGFLLDEPARPRGSVLVIHGFGANFYNSSLLRMLSFELAAHGWRALLANTRGHDSLCYLHTASGPIISGAAVETVSDAASDLAAWFARLHELTPSLPIYGIGHSLGGIKLLATLAGQATSRCGCHGAIALSPPRLHHETLLTHRRVKHYERALRDAQRAIEAGDPTRLIHVRFPFPMQVAPTTYLDKYGPASRYDWVPMLPRIAVPHVIAFGETELTSENPGFADAARIAQECPSLAPRSVPVFANANHQYEPARGELFRWIAQWLESQSLDNSSDDGR
jgi:pimeloyl-ACP methyl ester carboxylesterase